MIIQDLSLANNLIKNLYIKNRNRSLSGSFKFLRRQARFSSFGDYLILSLIASILGKLKIRISKNRILYAFNLSSELKSLPEKEKKALRQQLFEKLYVQKNNNNLSCRKDGKE